MAELKVKPSTKGSAAEGNRLVVRDKEKQKAEESDPLFAATAAPGQLGPQGKKSRLRLHRREEVSVYEEELDELYGFGAKDKVIIGLIVAVLVVFVAAIIIPSGAFALGKSPSVASFLANISSNIDNLLAYFSGENPYNVMHYEFCRYIVVVLAGAALGVSGGVYQSSMRNSLASPTTLGVVSGGTLGGMLFIILCTDDQAQTVVMRASDIMDYYASLSIPEYLAAVYGQVGFTLLGCFAVVAFVLLVSLLAGKGKVSGVVMIVTGQVVTMVAASVMTLVRAYYSSSAGGDALKATALQQVRSASFNAMYTELDLLFFGLPVLVCVCAIIAMRLKLNALAFSEDETRSMGISTVGTRYGMVAICTLMTALTIAFCGSIGFVGFVVPHLTRRLVGPGFKHYIPATALMGALFMLVACFASAFFSLDDFGGVRLLTALVGGVSFAVIALRGRNKGVDNEF